MAGSNICKSHGFDFSFVFFVESSNRFISKDINLNRPGIDFGQCLNFDIISPLAICSLLFDVFINIFDHIVPKKVFLQRNVIQADLPDFLVVLLISVQLV